MSLDSVAVQQVIVLGGADPTDRYKNMFILPFVPKILVFPKSSDGDNSVFEIGTCAANVRDLRDYLRCGIEVSMGAVP